MLVSNFHNALDAQCVVLIMGAGVYKSESTTHPLMPVMRKIRLPLILVQLTNLSMLLASTV